MKTKLFFSSLIFIGLLLYSCDPNGVNNSTGNYWERSALAQMNLNGKVKSITERGIVTSFNKSGLITSIENNSVGSSYSAIYTYNANGQITKIVKTSPNGSSQLITTTLYEYNNPGKYVLESIGSFELSRLIPNLSSITIVSPFSKDDYHKTEYVFKNATTMYIIFTFAKNSIIIKDSSTIKYNGNYPSELTDGYVFTKDITYASNGMFKSYTSGTTGPSTNYSEVYTFKTDNNCLLPESIQTTLSDTATPSNNFSYLVTYFYNDNKDFTEIDAIEYISKYTNYLYDSQENWTSYTENKKFKEENFFTACTPETRIITYW